MSTAISYPKDNDLSGLHLEYTSSGCVVTPFFTFALTDDEKRDGVYLIGSRYHEIKERSVDAFCQLMKLRRLQVMVTEKKIDGEIWWRLGSTVPREIPLPRIPTKPVLPENRGAIDI